MKGSSRSNKTTSERVIKNSSLVEGKFNTQKSSLPVLCFKLTKYGIVFLVLSLTILSGLQILGSQNETIQQEKLFKLYHSSP
jgi:hypothetical protein